MSTDISRMGVWNVGEETWKGRRSVPIQGPLLQALKRGSVYYEMSWGMGIPQKGIQKRKTEGLAMECHSPLTVLNFQEE